MANLDAKTKRELKACERTMKRLVAEIAERRDKLRQVHSDYEDILTSIDGFTEDFESVIDKLSELL